MIPVLPDVEILLDSGSGTYDFDLTDRVRLASLDVSGHGRSDEFDEANAGTLTVTLDNDDGALTSGAGFDELPFGLGGFGGPGSIFYPGQGIRYNVTVGATTVSRFTGRLTSAELGWEAETGLPSSVTLSAVDPLASLSRRNLRSMLEEEILLHSPTAYYTLGEGEGSTSAGDTSGNGRAPMTVAAGTAPVFGTDVGQAEGTGAAFVAGQRFVGPTFVPSTRGTVSVVLRLATSVTAPGDFVSAGGVDVGIVLAGNLGVVVDGGSVNWGPTPLNGTPHDLAVVCDGSTVWVYADGVAANHDNIFGPFDKKIGPVTIGPDLVGAVSHLAVFDYALTAGQVAAIHGASSGFAGDTTADRFARLATYGSLSTSTTTGMSGQTMSPQDTAGESFIDALNEVARAEGGVLFADGEGTIVLQGRGYRAGKTTADLTISADDIDVGTTAPLDDQQLVNQVTVNREGGATQSLPSASDLAGVELYPQSLDLVVDNDGDALRAAQWLIAKHTTATPRVPSASIDLMRCPQTEQIMAAGIGDRWEITDMPSQIWESFGDQTLEGWSETLTISGNTAAWTLTANLLPWALQTALVLDDSTYGALDSFPLMN